MTKYIGITGKKKAGKTTTIEFLIEKLKEKYSVGSVKIAYRNVSIEVAKEHHDIERMRKSKPAKTLFKSKNETVIFYNEEMTFRNALREFEKELDLVLLEGFPDDLEGFPQILLLTDEKEEKELDNDYIVAISSIPAKVYSSKNPKYVIFQQLDEIIEKFAQPLLPNLNCGHCGYKSCNEFIVEVLMGNKKLDDCFIKKFEQQELSLRINEKDIPCNLFVQSVLKNVILGVLKTLKLDFVNLDEIEIQVNPTKKDRESLK